MTQPAKPTARLLPGMLILLSLAITGYALWRTSGGTRGTLAKFGRQAPASPLVMPEKGDPDPRFQLATAWNAIAAPKAVRFDFPAGSEHGALLKSTAPGDLTGIGGRNTALGDPVFAVADGKVVYAGKPSAELGTVVVVAHTGPDGKPLRSVYARLGKSDAVVGSLVARGAKIGTMGTAEGHHPAGLLFSLESGASLNPPAPAADPRDTLGKLRNAAPEALAPSALSRM